MRRQRWFPVGAACAAALLFCALLLHASSGDGNQAAPQVQPTATSGPSTIADEAGAYALFAQLTASSVTRLCVATPESQYAFRCTDKARISVNGQQADRDVFMTLLDQILTLPVVTVEPFAPADEATATLTLYVDDAQYTAAFYREADEESPTVSIISRSADGPCYQRTDRWRLGTMLLACEGTRIQDEQGAETPMGND